MSLPQYSAPNAPFVGADGRLTFAGNAFLRQVWERIGGAESWSIGDLMQVPGNSSAALDVLAMEVDGARLAGEVAELRALVAELSKTDIEGQIAQLREQVAYMGLRRKRVVAGSISIGIGAFSGTASISPAVSSIDACDLRFLGCTLSTGTITDGLAAIELTNTTTVTAFRGTNTGPSTVYFQLTEYAQ